MKKFNFLSGVVSLVSVLTILGGSFSSFAAEDDTANDETNTPAYTIEIDDSFLSTAQKTGEETTRENGRVTTVTTYILDDGTVVTDTLTRGDRSRLRSLQGSDTATRTLNASGFGTASLTASFSWRTEGLFSYVKCTDAKASFSLSSGVTRGNSTLTKTSGEVALGTVNATLNFYLYKTSNPLIGASGVLKIVCNDEGNISNSGSVGT